MQSLPLEAKVRMTEARIKAWHEHWGGDVYISFSGGKDSTVLKHIADSLYPSIPSVFVNTGLEYPEVRSFALRQKNVIRLDPAMRFYDVIEKYGYPVVSKEQSQFLYEARTTKSEKLLGIRLNGNRWGKGKISEKWKFLIDAPFKISNKCCDVMKKAPVKKYERETGNKAIVGTMADESFLRRSSWLRYGCNAFTRSRPISQPMSFWTEQDVLRYVVENKLEIATVYGEVKENEDGLLELTGLQRTGCMFCMYGIDKDPIPNRFQRMTRTHPLQYRYRMEQLGLREVLTFMNIPFRELR